MAVLAFASFLVAGSESLAGVGEELGQAQAGSSTQSQRITGAPVRRALQRRRWVSAIVMLHEPTHRSGAASVNGVAAQTKSVLARLSASDFRLGVRWSEIPAFAGRLSAAGLGKLEHDPRVRRVDLDARVRAVDLQSLPLIRGDVAHALGYRGTGSTVAVIDSGIDESHPDLRDAIADEACFVLPSGCPNGGGEQHGPGSAPDDDGHGTNVAGIIAGAGQVAPVGVAPGARVVIGKVIDASGRGMSSWTLSALNWVIASHPEVRVINLSLGTTARFTGTCDAATAGTMATASAIRTLHARGTLVFAAVGNDADKQAISAPACIDAAIAVAAVYDSDLGSSTSSACRDATTAADQVTCWSDSSAALDLLAPGARITSTGRQGGITTYSGTSQASPHAAGAAALLFAANPGAGAAQAEAALKSTGRPVADFANGRQTPRIDVAAAIAAIQQMQAATISSFAPTSGPVGTRVTITGAHLNGASMIAFAGTTASFTVDSDSQVTAVVPAAATSGPVSVTTIGGTATTMTPFLVIQAPTIASLAPAGGPTGTRVTITGEHFSGATGVAFAGTTASFTVDSDTRITATVPPTATSGQVTVTTPGGTATGATLFAVTLPPVVKPVIGKAVVVPKKPFAGANVAISFAITRSDDGTRLTAGTMAVKPSVKGKTLPHRDQFKNGVALSRFRIPTTARGKTLTLRMTVTYKGQTASRTSTFRIG